MRRAQFAQTLSISHPVGKFAVSGEVWHFAQPLTHGYAVGNLWSASYPVRKNVVIDAGFDPRPNRQHLHALGELCWFHLSSAAAATLASGKMSQ